MRSEEGSVETLDDATCDLHASPAGWSDGDLDRRLRIILIARSDRSQQAAQRIGSRAINGILKLRMPQDGIHVRTKPKLGCEEPQASVMFGKRIAEQIVNAAVVVTGDELLFDCLFEFIRKAALQTNSLVVSGDPQRDRKSFRVGLM